MEEIKAVSFFFAFDHLFCQQIVLFTDDRHIFLTDRVIRFRRSHYRLNGDLLKAHIGKAEHILREIQIIVSKGSPHIIICLVAAVCKFFELRHDQIVTSLTIAERTHEIMYFFTPVNTHNHIGTFLIGELHNLIVKQYAIGGQCKTEFLIVGFFLTASISYQVFDYLPVHGWLTAKEIHLEISSGTGVGNQKIQSFFAHFKGHQRSAAMVFAFFRKAIATGQITVMGNMQTQGLDHCGSVCKMLNGFFINILGKQHALVF